MPRHDQQAIDRGRRSATLRASAASSKVAAGIGCMVASGAVVVLNDAVMKWMTADFPVGQILFIRGAFAYLPIALWVGWTGSYAALRIRDVRGQCARAALLIVASFLFVFSLGLMPLADATAISFAAPLFVTALATPLLGEFVGRRRWSAVVVGFAGVLLMLRPTGDAFQWVVLLPLGVAVAVGLADIMTRRISTTESSTATLSFTILAVALAGLATVPFGWHVPTAGDLALLALAGLLLGCAQYLMIEAYRLAEAVLVAPFRYSAMVWAVLFGFLIWGDLPDRWIVAGSLLVIGSGVYIFHRETRR
jgi:drug/metabolite transporter (DMT)-like permease